MSNKLKQAALLLSFLVLMLGLPAAPVMSQDSENLPGFEDEFEDAFDESDSGTFMEVNIDVSEIEPVVPKESWFHGYFKEELSFAYEQEEPYWNKIRSILNIKLEVSPIEGWDVVAEWNGYYDYAYTLEGRDRFTDETLDEYEQESEIRNFYFKGQLASWLQLTLGRQIIAWGDSDFFQVTDLVNPRDNRELALTDIEDARIPVSAVKLAFTMGDWELDLVAIPEIRTNKTPPNGSDFDPYLAYRSQGVAVEDEEIPESAFENSERLIRLYKTGSGSDMALVCADVFDDSAHLDLNTSSQGMTLVSSLIPKHKRIQTCGLSFNLTSGPFIWKFEGARVFNRANMRNDLVQELTNTAINPNYQPQSWTEKNINQLVLGLDYSGISDLTVTLEVFGEHIEEYEDNLLTKEDTAMVALQTRYRIWHDTLDFSLLLISLSHNDGTILRFNTGYDIIDAVNIGAGFIQYSADDPEAQLYNYRKQDRVFAALKYSF